MTKFNASAIAQQETVIEKVYREVFAKSPDVCRFTVEVRFNGGLTEYHSMLSLSKPKAQLEATEHIKKLVELNNYDRVAWRIVSESESSSWSLSQTNDPFQVIKPEHRKESLWSRFVNYFFLPEEEQFNQ